MTTSTWLLAAIAAAVMTAVIALAVTWTYEQVPSSAAPER